MDLINNEKGVSTLLSTLLVMGIFIFIIMITVPINVFIAKQSNINSAISTTLKEIEVAGHMTASIQDNLEDRLNSLGIREVDHNGVTYPDFTGTTTVKVLKLDANSEVAIQIKYPASNLLRYITLLSGAASSSDEGFFNIKKIGRSEAYE